VVRGSGQKNAVAKKHSAILEKTMHKMHPKYDHLPVETVNYIDEVVGKIACSYNLRHHDAEDLKQKLLLSATNRKNEYDASRNAALTTFLHLCVDGAVIAYTRNLSRMKNKKLLFILDAPVKTNGGDDSDGVEENLIDHIPSERAERERCSRDLKSDVAEIIKTLSPELRTVCVLFMEGKSAAEVAKVIGRPRQNIYSLILPKLRKAFAEIF